MDIQGELFDDFRPLPVKAKKMPAGVRYSRTKFKRRTLCDDCMAAIHELGIEVAPAPFPVRWRRTDDTNKTIHLLCEIHKRERLEAEK